MSSGWGAQRFYLRFRAGFGMPPSTAAAAARSKAGIGDGLQVPGEKCMMEAVVQVLPSRSIPASSSSSGFAASVMGLRPTI